MKRNKKKKQLSEQVLFFFKRKLCHIFILPFIFAFYKNKTKSLLVSSVYSGSLCPKPLVILKIFSLTLVDLHCKFVLCVVIFVLNFGLNNKSDYLLNCQIVHCLCEEKKTRGLIFFNFIFIRERFFGMQLIGDNNMQCMEFVGTELFFAVLCKFTF